MLSKFICILMIWSFILTTHSYNTKCLHHQKTLLLQLKHELEFDPFRSTKLVQWNQSDECCMWNGVQCDDAGYVISLQLDDEAISGEIRDSSSLFGLAYLEKLNLSNNDFKGPPIPKGIQNLTYLTHLDLSNAAFSGHIPVEMLSLRRLVSLHISNNNRAISPLKVENPNLEMLLQNLAGLRELYLDGVNITSSDERRKWSHIISSHLPNLTTLRLVDCGLSGPFASSFFQLHSLSILQLDGNDLSSVLPFSASFPSLTTLSLVGCSLNGSFPNMIFHIPTLQNLDLSSNHLLSGSIPAFTRAGSLKSIKLGGTNFSSSLPSSISYLNTLSLIDLSHCQFTGSIPSTFANLTKLIHLDLFDNLFTGSLSSTLFEGLSNLVYLDLGHNSLSGNIPPSLFGLPSLQQLWLYDNQFTGKVEEFTTVNFSKIVSLDLSGNRLEGPIPDSFFQLGRLKALLLPRNLFNGSFQLNKIQSLANLTYLDLSGNNLSVDVGNDHSSTFVLSKLNHLNLASCNLYGFPGFIQQSDIGLLDLSNNQIAGEIPRWIWGTHLYHLNLSFNHLTDLQKPYHIPDSLEFLDLHSNQLLGDMDMLIPALPSNVRYVVLGHNRLSGSIPTFLCNSTGLNVLDLSVNEFSGSIPSCLLGKTYLSVLNLGRNNISGHIPDFFSYGCSLQYFDVSNNTLGGRIPNSIESCGALEFMNVANNVINDSFPCLLSLSLRVLVLHSNRFYGEVRCHSRWPELQILDVSSNHFSGSLESLNISSWKAMMLDNDSQMRDNLLGSDLQYEYAVGVRLTMKGTEVEIVKIWPYFTAIDFSSNNFEGEIPNAIGDLSSLHLLNFSHNALNGSIPKSLGQLRELDSLDLSENQLTGEIPTELGELTFLSVLNLSYNRLVGKIPDGRQLQTFLVDSFRGNTGLCGFNINISCSSHTPQEHEDEEEKREIEWEYVFAAFGYVVGLGSIVWILVFCRSFREKYFGKIDEFVEDMYIARDMRRRRARRNHQARRQ